MSGINISKYDEINLGCGRKKESEHFDSEKTLGVDIADTESTDLIINLDSSSWDLPDNSFEYIVTENVFEHLENRVNFLEEIYRISKPGAKIKMITDHELSNNWADPTHRCPGASLGVIERFFTESGDYNFYSEARFKITDVKLLFSKRKIYPEASLVERVVNYSREFQDVYEAAYARNIPFLLPPIKISYELEVEK